MSEADMVIRRCVEKALLDLARVKPPIRRPLRWLVLRACDVGIWLLLFAILTLFCVMIRVAICGEPGMPDWCVALPGGVLLLAVPIYFIGTCYRYDFDRAERVLEDVQSLERLLAVGPFALFLRPFDEEYRSEVSASTVYGDGTVAQRAPLAGDALVRDPNRGDNLLVSEGAVSRQVDRFFGEVVREYELRILGLVRGGHTTGRSPFCTYVSCPEGSSCDRCGAVDGCSCQSQRTELWQQLVKVLIARASVLLLWGNPSPGTQLERAFIGQLGRGGRVVAIDESADAANVIREVGRALRSGESR